MDEYFNEILSSIYEIADNSSEHFFEWYDKIVKAIQNGLAQIDIDMEQFCIYPVGEYDCGTNLEELAPFKIVLEYTCEKSKIVQRIKYLELQKKKKVSLKNKIIMESMQPVVDNSVLTNSEISRMVEAYLKKSNIEGIATTVKQNSVFAKITEGEKVYNYVIIIAYKFINEVEQVDNKTSAVNVQQDNIDEKSSTNQTIIFKYKAKNYEMDYPRYYKLFDEKNQNTKGKYMDMVMLFKYMEFDLILNEKINYKTFTEFNLYEDLLYNVPNELYTESLNESIINCANYLYNININDLKTVEGKKMVKEKNDIQEQKKIKEYLSNTITEFYKQFDYLN